MGEMTTRFLRVSPRSCRGENRRGTEDIDSLSGAFILDGGLKAAETGIYLAAAGKAKRSAA
jgi:hypothetical protein